ncbi:undecaprenyl-diphosphate phosphatase [Nitrospina gracilis]|uniref:undecaprenyl-diphosphate phosphatase n=1 Tax=Nitrospina gracilis TaxID=35801 RepID=UPI001F332334|nr:undecaprenyl-diphosphate phosphatase [Nitrospina gracilis]MCF8720763.1 undecaprenyl-diphosphatase [Nitrospina gracilis Nb-211]
MEDIQAILLGLIQGLTEFLPVSSSGHLILVPILFDYQDQGLAMDAILHLATLLAIIIFFRRELWQLLCAMFDKKNQPARHRVAWGIIVATVPAGVVGLSLGDWIEANLRSPVFVGTNLIFWSFVFWWADRGAARTDGGEAELNGMSFKQILLIGCAQAVALFPGTSRSGITIAAGLFMNLSQPAAARFAFLLGTPAILAAGLHKTVSVITQPEEALIFTSGQMAMAFSISFLSGYLAIKILLTVVSRVGLIPFVIYRLLLGGFILAIY